MDHICFHGVVSSNEAVSRLLANSILLCDIKDYHSMRAEKKKNHSETAQREELLGTERTINSNLYLMSKRTEHEQKKKGQGQPVTDFTMRFISTYADLWRMVPLQWGAWDLTFLLHRSNLSLVTGGTYPCGLSESRLQHPLKHGIQIIQKNSMPCFESIRIIHKWQQIV